MLPAGACARPAASAMRDAAGCDQHADDLAPAQSLHAEQRRDRPSSSARASRRPSSRARRSCRGTQRCRAPGRRRSTTAPSSATAIQSRPFGQGWRSTQHDRQQHQEGAAEAQGAERQRIDIGDHEARRSRPPSRRGSRTGSPPGRRCARSCAEQHRGSRHGRQFRAGIIARRQADAEAPMPRNSAALAASDGKKHSMRISCRVTSCGVPSVAMVVNIESRASPLRK